MKLNFYFLTLIFLSIYQVSAQTPITIGGTCSDSEAFGVYNYDGDINGKPSYRKGEIDCITILTSDECDNTPSINSTAYFISWNGSAWEWSRAVVDCVWIVSICVPKTAGPVVTLLANSLENTTLPACNGWASAAGGCLPDITGCEILSTAQNIFSNNIVLYPNPTKGNISIDLGNTNRSISVSLISLIGEVIWVKDFNNISSFQLEINQPTGMYLVEIKGDKGEKKYIKVIKK